jgi:hypothetical protein
MSFRIRPTQPATNVNVGVKPVASPRSAMIAQANDPNDPGDLPAIGRELGAPDREVGSGPSTSGTDRSPVHQEAIPWPPAEAPPRPPFKLKE